MTTANEATMPNEDVVETAPTAEEGVFEAESPETDGPDADGRTDAKKQPISLRLSVEDLALAKELAGQLNMGYQVLLNELIHEGLKHRQDDLKVRKLVAQLKASLPEMKAAQELLNSPAVKTAQDLLNNPAVKQAQELVSSPAIKAAQELAGLASNPTVLKVKEFGSNTAAKASQELANSKLAKMFNDMTTSEAFKTVQELATSTQAKLSREWDQSPAGRLANELAKTANEASEKVAATPEMKDLAASIEEIKQALKKANLMA